LAVGTLGAMTSDDVKYHIGFAASALPEATTIAVLSGDPERSELIATEHLSDASELARNRGLDSFLARLPGGAPIVRHQRNGAPSMSIVVNELVQVGIRTIIRIGTSGSIQPHVRVGSVVVSSGALCRQGAADDIARPSTGGGRPLLTVVLAQTARDLGIEHTVGITASTDTFFEGQERSEMSANPHLIRRLQGINDEYQRLRVLNYEMEAATLFKMGQVYGFAAACVCAIIAQRTEDERPRLDEKDAAVDRAIAVALGAAERWSMAQVRVGWGSRSARRRRRAAPRIGRVTIAVEQAVRPPCSHRSWRQRPHGITERPWARVTTAISRPPPVACSTDTSPHSAHNPSPYDAFSTLQAAMMRPSSTRAAAPTWKCEHGT
jgi:uridine phosphorylase